MPLSQRTVHQAPLSNLEPAINQEPPSVFPPSSITPRQPKIRELAKVYSKHGKLKGYSPRDIQYPEETQQESSLYENAEYVFSVLEDSNGEEIRTGRTSLLANMEAKEKENEPDVKDIVAMGGEGMRQRRKSCNGPRSGRVKEPAQSKVRGKLKTLLRRMLCRSERRPIIRDEIVQL